MILGKDIAIPQDVKVSELSDGYHTFMELYEFRKMYNAALFNAWAEQGKYQVHKSKRHYDGEECFGGGWFIVVALLPEGQITNHYKLDDWGLFRIPEFKYAQFEYDGHTGKDTLERLKKVCELEENHMKSTMPPHCMTDKELIREAENSEDALAKELAKRFESERGAIEAIEILEERIAKLEEKLAEAESSLADCEAELD